MDDAGRIALFIVVLVFSCVFHECAHVWSAWKMGDPTGRDLGRLTLNPLPHIDLFWSILLPIFMLVTAGFPFGGPKPAPVNPGNFRNPRVDSLWCALAGPGSNLLLAAGGMGLLWALVRLSPSIAPPDSWNAYFFLTVFVVNMVLAIVNLLPVPPLDGFRFVHFLVGRPLDPVMDFAGRMGWLLFIPIFLTFRLLAPLAVAPFLNNLYPALYFMFGGEYAGTLWESYWAR
jgi:Zn-dependent protease